MRNNEKPDTFTLSGSTSLQPHKVATMKLWLVSAGWDYEGAIVVAVCTTEELAEKAKAIVEGSERFDYYEIRCAETDAFNVTRYKDGETRIQEVGDNYAEYIPILEYQPVKAV
jgi:hypothetical protein